MNIVVTGSSGFLGKTLCNYLKVQGHFLTKLTSANCDLKREDSLRHYNDLTYDLIYHLAAWTQAGDFCIKHPGEQWIANQKINTNVLTWWATQQPQAKLVFMGTSCVYAPNGDLKESEYMVGEPIDSLYTYAMTKRMLYQGARALSKQFGLRYLCAVPSTLYGPGYHTDGRQMHFIFDLIKKIIRGKEHGEQVVLWGDGYQRREIILVDDFVNILFSLNKKYNNEIFNIGAGEEYTIRYFSKIICEIVGYQEEKIIYDQSKYVGATSKVLNIDKAKAMLHSNYNVCALNIGLERTIKWFYQSKSWQNRKSNS
jgi:GDP-L-fucose synthase